MTDRLAMIDPVRASVGADLRLVGREVDRVPAAELLDVPSKSQPARKSCAPFCPFAKSMSCVGSSMSKSVALT